MIKKFLIIAFALVVSACATVSPVKQSFQEGRANFKAKNYSLAFKQLMPAAQSGVPEAQYAVGYMYYYGLGTHKNLEQARRWIQMSASRGLPKAQKANALINSDVWSR